MNFGNRRIEASNLPELDSFALGKIELALNLSFDKLQRIVNNEMLFHAHFKKHEREGKRAKHSVHLKLSIPGKTLVSSETGWNPVNVLQKALGNLERETIRLVKRS